MNIITFGKYKGKTELRITYEGNTPVDSAVVFKK